MSKYNLQEAKRHLEFQCLQYEKRDDTDKMGTVWAMLDAIDELILEESE